MRRANLLLARLAHRYSGSSRRRGAVIRSVAKQFDLVSFGTVHQDDDIEPVRGFTTSITHLDSHLSVGSYDDFPIRIVDRFDIVRMERGEEHPQNWCIVEVKLENLKVPHICLVPAGRSAHEYYRLFSSHTHLQPLNTTIFQHHSREFHGRFQILASTTHSAEVEELLTTPLVLGIAARFWPYGVEMNHDTLYVYITDHRISKTVVSGAITSALWLAQSLDARA